MNIKGTDAKQLMVGRKQQDNPPAYRARERLMAYIAGQTDRTIPSGVKLIYSGLPVSIMRSVFTHFDTIAGDIPPEYTAAIEDKYKKEFEKRKKKRA